METFCILKSKYLDTKLSFLDALEKDRQYADVEEREDCSPKDIEMNERFADERWASYISIINAASMLLNYVADCAMSEVHDSHYMCYIEGEDLIEDVANPSFPFTFKFLVMPKLEGLKKKKPYLDEILEHIKYRDIPIENLASKLDEADIPHGDVETLVEFPDNYFLRRPFSKWVDYLADQAERRISEFAQERQ